MLAKCEIRKATEDVGFVAGVDAFFTEARILLADFVEVLNSSLVLAQAAV